MAEKILIGNSYQKEMYLTVTDEYGNEEPSDLTKYDDCYVAFKKDRTTADEDSYLIKKIEPSTTNPGIINIYLTPEETKMLPLTSFDELPYIWMFVQLGSTATGETIEVGAYKVKTQLAGIHYYTEQDRTLDDLGYIKGYVGYVFDCGYLCEPPLISIDISGGEPYITDCGYLVTNGQYQILDLGKLTDPVQEFYDLGKFERSCR